MNKKILTIGLVLTMIFSVFIVVSQRAAADSTPDIQFIFDNTNDRITIASVYPSGYVYSNSSSPSGANLIFMKDNVTYYVGSNLSIVTSGVLSTKEIVAGDVISGFSAGTYQIIWKPTGVVLATFTFTGGNSVPTIQFVKNDVANTLTVSSVDPGNVLWSDINVDGTCDTSGLGTYVTAGDVISGCYGTITLAYVPLNVTLGVWEFTSLPSVPSISFVKNSVARTLTVSSVDPGNVLWSDINVDGTCDTSGLGTYVTAGDVISGCYGTITLAYVPLNVTLGVWEFTSLPSVPSISFVKNSVARTLTVSSVDPGNVLWSDINVDGTCDTSGLGTYVTAGDVISGCYGTITLAYVPLNVTLGVWEFTSLPSVPSISFVKNSVARTLTVSSVDPGNVLWSDINVDGTCDTSGLGTYVTAGDVISGCYGTITLAYVPLNVTLGVWEFTSLPSVPSISFVYDDWSKRVTITSADPGYHYSNSNSISDANLVFIKNNMTYYYVGENLSICTFGDLTTQEIQAGDTISGFTIGTYFMFWKPTWDFIGSFVVSAQQPEYGQIHGTVYGRSENTTYLLPNATVSVREYGENSSTWRVTFTNNYGFYTISLTPGWYELEASKEGYVSSTQIIELNVHVNQSNEYDFVLDTSSGTTPTENRTLIYEAIKFGYVGGELNVWETDDKIFDHEILIYDGVAIQNLNIEKGILSFTVSGNETSGGKTIAINVGFGVFNSSSGTPLVEYDGESIKMADDISDVLNPNDDGSNPEYLMVMGANGIQILISIPHFSDHEIAIFGLAENVVEALGGITAVMVYIAICLLLLLFLSAPSMLEEKSR